MSHLIYGVQEQNYIAHVMAYAMCVGPYHGDCERPDDPECVGSASVVGILPMAYLLLISFFAKAIFFIF